MKIAAISISNIDAASSRLRSFYLFKYSTRFGIKVIRNFSFREGLKADILHIQKAVSIRNLMLALIFRFSNKIVIYDIDDQPTSYLNGRFIFYGAFVWFAFASMIAIANCITTDTPERANYWRHFGFRNISVIPDIVDIDPETSYPCIYDFRYKGYNQIVWVGNGININSIKGLIDYLSKQNEIQFTIISDAKSIMYISQNWPWIKVRQWSHDIMQAEEFRLSAMVLNHDVNTDSHLKSENKFVLAIASGIVPIVSNTPAYTRLAKALDAERLIFKDIVDAPKIAQELDIEWIRYFFLRAREYINYNYTAEVSLKNFLNIIGGL